MATIRFEQDVTAKWPTWSVTARDEDGRAVDIANTVVGFEVAARAGELTRATLHVAQPELVGVEVPEERVSWRGLERVPAAALRAELAIRESRGW